MNYQAAIEVSELADNLHHPRLVILDCRYNLAAPEAGHEAGHRAFLQSHIPGARYASLHRDLSAPVARYGGRHPLPSAEQFQRFARNAGISSDSQVVVYDDQRLAFAARAWWLLRYFGHQRVCILNGGFSAWRSAHATADGMEQAVPAGDFSCLPQEEMMLNHDDIYPELGNPPWQLIDARDPQRFSGTLETLDPIAGHIPTAVNKPWQSITDDQGMLKSRKELLVHWRDIPEDERLVNYCGSGVTACVNLFSLHLIGRRGALLYPGSWSDWCARILFPVNPDPLPVTHEFEP